MPATFAQVLQVLAFLHASLVGDVMIRNADTEHIANV